ncbi:MAG: bifunctional DNA-formamidopyrimidine glycosylase/DNA-(apurinic or apyrimidinic site) lyase [Candidatus Competibacteraceae bacterium]
MPELPEVETTRQGIAPHLTGQTVTRVLVRERRLRWPVPSELETALDGQAIRAVERRGKYLLLRTEHGSALLHLGMSGSLRLLPQQAPLRKHDHVDIELASGYTLRLNDPRRFGALLWAPDPPESHPLLRELGPEPLSEAFNAAYLHRRAHKRSTPIKLFIMNGRIVVGVGNIYANEALFAAGIHPARAAGRIALARYEVLVQAIREVLSAAIARGGTTLRDFVNGNGEAGYFQNELRVYDRGRRPCSACGEPIRLSRLGQRATYHCPRCQR